MVIFNFSDRNSKKDRGFPSEKQLNSATPHWDFLAKFLSLHYYTTPQLSSLVLDPHFKLFINLLNSDFYGLKISIRI